MVTLLCDIFAKDPRLLILRELKENPKGLRYTDILNKVAMDDLIISKLMEQLRVECCIEGELKAHHTIRITARGASEFYCLQQERRRLARETFWCVVTTAISLIALIVSIFASAAAKRQHSDDFNNAANTSQDYSYAQQYECPCPNCAINTNNKISQP